MSNACGGRLVIVGKNLIDPASCSTSDCFSGSFAAFCGWFRAIRWIPVPADCPTADFVLCLYGMSAFDEAEGRRLRLIIERNQLADKLDCYLQCGCTSKTVLCQIVLDKILYDLDHANRPLCCGDAKNY